MINYCLCQCLLKKIQKLYFLIFGKFILLKSSLKHLGDRKYFYNLKFYKVLKVIKIVKLYVLSY